MSSQIVLKDIYMNRKFKFEKLNYDFKFDHSDLRILSDSPVDYVSKRLGEIRAQLIDKVLEDLIPDGQNESWLEANEIRITTYEFPDGHRREMLTSEKDGPLGEFKIEFHADTNCWRIGFAPLAEDDPDFIRF